MRQKKRVLYVSSSANPRIFRDPAARYRCYHFAERLSEKGNTYCSVISHKDFNESMISCFDTFVFHKPASNPEMMNLILSVKNKKKKLIADYDDLIFNPAYALESSIYKNNRIDERDVTLLFERNTEMLMCFDQISVSTEPLCREAKKLAPHANIKVFHNFLSQFYVEAADIIRARFGNKKEKMVGYFSGTKSHDKDIEIVGNVLNEVVKETGAKLLCMGPVEIPVPLQHNKFLEIVPVKGYRTMLYYLNLCATVIAPLEFSIFNECKSGLKFFESAYMGCNVVATPIPDIERFRSLGAYLPTSDVEWKENIIQSLAYKDKEALEHYKQEVLAACSGQVELQEYLDFIN